MIPELIQLVEALRRPGVMSAVGMKRERACASDVASYFGLLHDRIDALNLGALATEPIDVAVSHADMAIARVVRQTQPMLLELLLLNLYHGFLEGDALADVTIVAGDVREADRRPGTGDNGPPPPSTLAGRSLRSGLSNIPGALQPVLREIDRLGLTGKRAADYAAKRSASLVRGLDKTTRELLRQAIEEGIRDKLGVDGLGRLIRQTVLDMSTYRSRMIASTEMNDAFSQAALEKMKKIGIEFKRLVLAPGACKICIANAAAGPIPVDQAFESGEQRTPFHPWCRCAVVGSRAPADA